MRAPRHLVIPHGVERAGRAREQRALDDAVGSSQKSSTRTVVVPAFEGLAQSSRSGCAKKNRAPPTSIPTTDPRFHSSRAPSARRYQLTAAAVSCTPSITEITGSACRVVTVPPLEEARGRSLVPSPRPPPESTVCVRPGPGATAQVGRPRRARLRIGARVTTSVRCVVLRLDGAHPWASKAVRRRPDPRAEGPRTASEERPGRRPAPVEVPRCPSRPPQGRSPRGEPDVRPRTRARR
jgi:hypothetical protein